MISLAVRRRPACASRYQAMNTTIDQPMPMSSRLAPVMLARASEQGDSPVAPGGLAGGAELLDRVAALPGEDEVDGVLGEHGDEGEDGDGQAGRDVELGHLGRPRQQEGGADDGQAEDERPPTAGSGWMSASRRTSRARSGRRPGPGRAAGGRGRTSPVLVGRRRHGPRSYGGGYPSASRHAARKPELLGLRQRFCSIMIGSSLRSSGLERADEEKLTR